MKRARVAPALTSHNCVILAVDTAQRSGWAITVRGMLYAAGEFDLLGEPGRAHEVCGYARHVAEHQVSKTPTVLVFERPFGGTSQGQYIGAWKTAWVASGGVVKRMLGVYPATWRARVLGSRYARAERKEVREAEQRMAQVMGRRDAGPDEAAAICIARWASYAGEVGARLPKGRTKAA